MLQLWLAKGHGLFAFSEQPFVQGVIGTKPLRLHGVGGLGLMGGVVA
jgi:hypothetical protein